jgi:hypothetical protein
VGKGTPWWLRYASGADDSSGLGDSDRAKALVKVLSGDEEIAALTTPKVPYQYMVTTPC